MDEFDDLDMYYRDTVHDMYVDSIYEINTGVLPDALYFWKRNLSAEEYFDEVNRYIDFANKVIKHRGKFMLAALKEFMSL